MQENKHLNRIEFTGKRAYNIFNYNENSFTIISEGIVKLNLYHSQNGSVLSPDFLLYNKKYWLQPINFTVPVLGKFDDSILAIFNIDINCGKTIKIKIFNHGFIEELSDKSQLYKCEIHSNISNLDDYSCGQYKTVGSEYYLKMYHHTDKKAYRNIIKSKELWSSQWNIRGNKKCQNHSYVYFTHIPSIEMNDDLIPIAMVKENEFIMHVDGFQPPALLFPGWKEKFKDSIYIPEVYRSSTEDRKLNLSFWIPMVFIDKKHLYQHDQNERVFYEIFMPHIHRIKTILKNKLLFDKNFVIQTSNNIVFSNYCVKGDARFKEGLAAPFEEEETEFIFKQQDCKGNSILSFWFDNANKDLFTKNDTNFNIFD